MQRYRLVKALQPSYVGVVSEIALEAVRAKMSAARDPFATYDYAEAIDALVAIMPPEVKATLNRRLGVDVDTVVEEALNSCERDEYAHPYVNQARCLRVVKRDLDKLLRAVFDVAHRHGLFVVEREEVAGREG